MGVSLAWAVDGLPLEHGAGLLRCLLQCCLCWGLGVGSYGIGLCMVGGCMRQCTITGDGLACGGRIVTSVHRHGMREAAVALLCQPRWSSCVRGILRGSGLESSYCTCTPSCTGADGACISVLVCEAVAVDCPCMMEYALEFRVQFVLRFELAWRVIGVCAMVL